MYRHIAARNIANTGINQKIQRKSWEVFVFLEQDSWFAVQVLTQNEKKVAILLEQKGYKLFVPTYKAVRQWCDRTKMMELPLFPGYVFCHFEASPLGLVASTPGVIRIVSFGGKPCSISAEEIAQIQRVVATGARIAPCKYFNVGERVRVVSGPLTGVSGILRFVKNSHRIVICVETIMKSVAVEVDASQIASSAEAV